MVRSAAFIGVTLLLGVPAFLTGGTMGGMTNAITATQVSLLFAAAIATLASRPMWTRRR